MASFVGLGRDRFGRLDVLVNNAGLRPLSPLDQLKVDEWERMVDINIKGVLYGIAAALPVLRAQGGASGPSSSSPSAGLQGASQTLPITHKWPLRWPHRA